ncbi:MAG: class II aldolase/adducin family protein [Oribacterium sp.]|nr:class II aldolase/adducin family protein [Oribacterium sp.]
MNQYKQEIIETGKWVMEKTLTWGTSGNISVRDGDQVYVTASGTVLGNLTEEDITVVNLDGEVLEGRKASKETGMHLAVYRKRPEVRAVLHASPFWTTFAACTSIELKKALFIESMYYDEHLVRVPYFHAGSRELAQAVSSVVDQTHVILMEHHGMLCYDRDLKECRSALEVTENVCRMNIIAQSSGILLKELPQETVRDFLEGGYYKQRR